MKKILTIEGGGIKGVFPASFLATIEETLGDNVANYFDLIVGTSTGGIIALGLGLGFSAKEILEFYENSGPQIFKGNRMLRLLRHIWISKYSQEPLKRALESIFDDRKLGESTKRLVIPSLDLETGKVHVYKTSHNPRLEQDYKLRVVDVALATAAAPTYFPTHRSAAGTPLVDGGLWANNPVGMAVVEAITLLDWPRDSLRVLSIGCIPEPLKVRLGRKWALGLGYWGFKIVSVFMAAQSSASEGTAKLLAGHENVIRINPPVEAARFNLDVVKEIPSLKGLGYTEAREAIPSLRPIFFGEYVEKFTPCHRLSS